MQNNDSRTDVILNSIAEGVITVDKEFKITFINEAAEKITGFKKDEVIGQFCKNVFKSEFCLSNCPIAQILRNGKSVFDLDTFINCSNSEVLPIRINAAVLKDENNIPTGGVITFRDISLFKQVEDIIKAESQFHGMIGKNKAMKEIYQLVMEISDSDAHVLIMGETGTGKELIANAIQATSKRKKENFVKINCSVIPHNLLGSELFGHAKGAFTDAKSDRIGRFELANNGTIFLDEIAEMPLQMQTQILRVIQEGTFERLGESATRKTDVRIIAATNMNLENAISSGKFREDLFYRLSVLPIEVPPLRKRKDDIPLLIDYFIRKFSFIYKKKILGIDESALDLLINWQWPGNIRELENSIEYAVIKSRGKTHINSHNLPLRIKEKVFNGKSENKNLQTIEHNSANIIELLNTHKWNKTKVAEILGVDRTTLWRKLKSLGID
ncbi:MAG: sigma-54-dependent Fis family transcriptional regulator [Ignavibacteria bacterium RIFOXYB2_FULL_35_12]|nr:MAG: sigma-54-dependent Fis family transcriptional regulator [Ignavibacteria bacterium GWA2_36_19]OGU51400.1 MAG: sigma-54-dependent Fis family transcriptional regulator [Ignavibacteria bacterium GWC2_35_8]OGU59129.1 MAG: sigma-54-dependent Fis family transcriptional regulator [Ignavibacteria bacterium GWF2_35_20]OGU82024.1 MAG: sigma-54-dependent Fis family transcriptional regulator [Ignavibacteria bacterium RIFOXYA2_FULL_35_9]OGU88605.1 MAG: sigma-54-dependent Fis family transcriptional re